MVNEHAEAISIANYYFMLVDGMVPGFKDHLAEHVVLKWFGNVITGRKKVTTFLLSNKTESVHKFPDIMPISGISHKSKQSNWKIKQSLEQNDNCGTYMSNYLPACSSHESEMSTTHVKDCDDQKSNANDATSIDKAASNEFQDKKGKEKLKTFTDCKDMNTNIDMHQNKFSAIAEMDDQSYDLNRDDLYNLFKPEITSQPVVGKNINRIKLKEEMAPTVRAINRELDQEDGPVTADANTTNNKYLEANGEIKFIRINTQTDSLYWSNSFIKKKTWIRKCKLQITYSLLNDVDSSKVARKCHNAQKNNCVARKSELSTKVCHDTDKTQESKLPNLEEAIQISNTLIPDVNHFGGYLQPLNFLEDREDFLKLFEAEIAKKNSNTHFCLRYDNNKLISNCPNKKPFNVMYQIHEIVYSKAQVNTPNTQEITI
ncbi:PREDICTED: uncharacterized protein LOC105154081 [Acromyrmex echinatior]|uniref:Uncharacterized protein n=1 Tax=Acromyrmex echinatior TaxID=103372 RepID=F4X8Q6_ACREC|nr:PREDICTED: uncharacterized protein LOC105154081 [Acromyrmex echinatior]XP_011067651.1 PREDICTED: uncharacterized protein LOC105154081 [Acromyrmex echinatior]XP_011067652.1 PREDICTED: uncharacterized protein LOC105154081 [Acromyrmex echinatior]EGI57325.1 hypothetical protein G5I_14796 [Acromyrmex echinatior]